MSHTGNRWLIPLTFILVVFLTAAAYSPVLDNQFVTYDDAEYVTDNAAVLSGLSAGSLTWAFSSSHSGNWHPLTWLSHMLDVSLYGLKPGGHHFTSLLMHTANTWLLFLLLRRMTGAFRRSLAVAMLFALHPLHVESVAWVAERKDLLCTFFLFLTLLSYCRYIEKPNLPRYLLALLLGICSLMSKQMFVTLPLILLLLDWWPLKRFALVPAGRMIAEKAPFLVAAAGAAVVSYLSHQEVGTVGAITAPTLLENAGRAVVNAAAYLYKMVLPANLAVFYPYRPEFPQAVVFVPSATLFLAATGAALSWRRRFPFILFGWLWYLVTLLPVSGIVQIGNMSIADRYTYVPLVGPFILCTWALGEAVKGRARASRALTAGAVAVLLLLAAGTFRQTRYWFNSITLFSHASRVVENNWLACNDLGSAFLFLAGGESSLNIAHSVRQPIPPSIAEAAGVCGATPAACAVNALREAVRIWPEYELAHYNLALAYLLQNDMEAALGQLRILSVLNRDLAVALAARINAARQELSPPD